MRFSLSVAGQAWTKSSIDVDEDKLSDINLYAYRDGRLEEEIYIGNMPHEAEMVLSGKYEYKIYALANTGRIRAPEDEQELVSMVYAAGDGNTFEERGWVFLWLQNCRSSPRLLSRRYLYLLSGWSPK